jgi:hypothetical protein
MLRALPVTWPECITRSGSLAVAADSCQVEDISWREQGDRLIDLHPGCAQARNRNGVCDSRIEPPDWREIFTSAWLVQERGIGDQICVCMCPAAQRTVYCTRKFLADGPEVRREYRIGGKELKYRFSSREIIASKESVSSISIFNSSSSHPFMLDRSAFEFRLEPSRLLRTACYAFHFTRVLLAPGWE